VARHRHRRERDSRRTASARSSRLVSHALARPGRQAFLGAIRYSLVAWRTCVASVDAPRICIGTSTARFGARPLDELGASDGIDVPRDFCLHAGNGLEARSRGSR